jgi:hypothetical protein
MTTSRDEAVTTEEHAAPPEAWDVIADGYDRYVAPQEVDLANEALRLVGLQPGERCLDVAAGTGGLGLPAARQGAQVLATAPAADRRGLKDVRVERTAERPAFTSGQEMWDWVLYGNPIPGMLVADLTEDKRARLRQVLDGMLRERAGANGRAVLENAVNIGIGTK